jgi:hypothetical protein
VQTLRRSALKIKGLRIPEPANCESSANRVATFEANEVAHENRIEKAESDANQYRQNMSEVRDRISRIEGYLKRLTQ